jgi:transcription termination/antitermination protein NusA
MDPKEILRVVDAIHRDEHIDKEIVFRAIEAGLVSVSKRHCGAEADIVVEIDRTTGAIHATNNGVPIDMGHIVERIGAQAAKDLMIQKVREAQRRGGTDGE